ncbi:heparan sulfate 2-O-sulfotransferase isoform X3 [Oratosquilla oratoria]|uniref:heparan sulfate 2-O-sulfotransferase isoform X3 n=1 Tax=Oratosquilla oratoria TaxID=337810 RepID=UPI003F75E6A5
MWALGSRTWTLGLTALALILLLLYGRLAAQLSQLHPATLQLTTARRLSPNLDVSGGGWGGGPGEGAQSLLASGGGGAFSLGADFDPSRAVIIYNRVPKTGSTTFIGLAYDLCATNGFHVLHVNTTKNSPTLSLTDQVRFVSNVTNWDQKKPAIYHGHIAFLDFSRFGVLRQPLYINILREPLERLVSYYYFIRYGDDLRPHLVRKRMGNKMTFDECVARQHVDCSAQHLWLQVPFFCGHHADCWEAGNPWALEEAKRNLAHHYFLVGVTDQMEDFVALMEFAFPSLFRGASRLYRTGKKSHLRKTAQKFLPSEETIAKIQSTKVWQLEHEFYEFAQRQFQWARRRTLQTLGDGGANGRVVDRGQNFNFEKIKPDVYVCVCMDVHSETAMLWYDVLPYVESRTTYHFL